MLTLGTRLVILKKNLLIFPNLPSFLTVCNFRGDLLFVVDSLKKFYVLRHLENVGPLFWALLFQYISKAQCKGICILRAARECLNV